MARWPFATVIEKLRARHGAPKKPPSSDPFELICWENCAYLVDEERRSEAFAKLKAKTRLDPMRILEASQSALEACVAAPGRFAALQAEKLRTSAEIAIREHDGDLAAVLGLEPAKAIKAIRRFPAIGEPGAEKILLFAGKPAPELALESNGLRALVRLGFGEESRDYRRMYKSVQAAIAPELPKGAAPLVAAHQLLRIHGQILCTRSSPDCPACPLRPRCPAGF
jgi:endonuclease III